jgi:hypothetical protein
MCFLGRKIQSREGALGVNINNSGVISNYETNSVLHLITNE